MAWPLQQTRPINADWVPTIGGPNQMRQRNAGTEGSFWASFYSLLEICWSLKSQDFKATKGTLLSLLLDTAYSLPVERLC